MLEDVKESGQEKASVGAIVVQGGEKSNKQGNSESIDV